MSTISKEIAQTIIDNERYYPGDHVRVTKIVTYNNQFDGGLEYAMVYEHQDQMRYEESSACHNVTTIWSI